MNNLWLKIRIWTKVTLFGVVAIYLILFFVNNGREVTLWLWPGESGLTRASLLVLLPVVFMLGVIVTLLVRTIWKTLSQVKELKRRKSERDAAEVVSRAARLRTRGTGEAL